MSTKLSAAAIFFFVAGSRQGEANLRRATRVLAGTALAIATYSGLQALVLTGNERWVPTPIVDVTQYARQELWFGGFRLYGTYLRRIYYGAVIYIRYKPALAHGCYCAGHYIA